MLKTAKKLFVFLLLVVISVSFTGCLGLSIPTTSNNNKKETVKTNVRENDSQGVFKTTDGGVTWEHKITIENSETRLDQIKIGSMAMNPKDNNMLFLGTMGKGLYKTVNGGDSWFKVEDKNGFLKSDSSIYDIAIEDSDLNIIYIATLNEGRGVLLRSVDGGDSWSQSYIITEQGKQVNSVDIYQKTGEVYIGTEQGGVVKSTDRGDSWYAFKWFEKESVREALVDPTNNNGIVVLTSKNVYKTIDGGADPEESWEELKKPIAEASKIKMADISSMTMDKENPLIIYITYANLVLVTRDGGYTWENLKTITPALTVVNTAPNVKQIGLFGSMVYYGAGNALYKSDNRGVTWSSMDIPIKGDARYTVSDYTNPDVIYVGTFYDPPEED